MGDAIGLSFRVGLGDGDVVNGRTMRRTAAIRLALFPTLLLFLFVGHLSLLFAGEKSSYDFDKIAFLQNAEWGRIALCKPSVVDELQIIGEVRRLTLAEAQKIGSLLASEKSWFEKTPDGEQRGWVSFSSPHWDIKLTLRDKSGEFLMMRLDTSCCQVSVTVDRQKTRLPNLREQAMNELAKLLNDWFPGWQATTYRNKSRWLQDILEKRQ
jgi:hypothetical protein